MKNALLFIFILLFISLNNNEYIDLSNYKSKTISVEIKGEVNKPGVYELPYNTKVGELIAKAGNYTLKANSDNLNEARILKNEEVIVVEEINKEDVKLVSINSADAETLCTIKGVGPSTASKIIEYRNNNGGFKTLEELMNVAGIKEKTFNKLKDYITL